MSLAHETEEYNVRDQVSDEEWRARVDLAALYRLIAHYKWDDLVFTHISMRVPGEEPNFLVNPFGLLFREITASSLLKVDLDGSILIQTPYIPNPAAVVIHAPIQGAREDARCIIHLHTDYGVAVSAQEQGLLPISQQSIIVTSSLAYHEYEGIAVDRDECARLVADLGDKHAMILRNHGTLAVGASAGMAFARIYSLERSCATQVMAQSGGAKLHEVDPAVLEKVKAQMSGFTAGRTEHMAWPALLRLLDDIDPSYKQ